MDRSEEYMKALRHAQIRAYFFGQADNALAPHSQSADFNDLNLFKIIEGKLAFSLSGVEGMKLTFSV